ncbi:MAG TPA: DUF5752 family protein [Nitrososphaerales archaeon]|nr:DUF5752 family protein [Nitrososphaerales archaeon]
MSVAKGLAERITSPVSQERSFYFYLEVGMPLDPVARSLKEFGEILKTVDMRSLEFHSGRGDFEKWVYMLGDVELSKSLVKIRNSGFKGEKLRSELVRAVQTRVRQLQRATSR